MYYNIYCSHCLSYIILCSCVFRSFFSYFISYLFFRQWAVKIFLYTHPSSRKLLQLTKCLLYVNHRCLTWFRLNCLAAVIIIIIIWKWLLRVNMISTYKSNETGFLIDYSYIIAYTNKRTHSQATTRIKSRF